MSIASRINAIEEHLTDDYSVLELAGADLTNVDKNIINLKPTWKERLLYFINNGTEVVWNNWDKVIGEGTSLTLNNTLEAKMKIDLKGNTYQYSTTGKNLMNLKDKEQTTHQSGITYKVENNVFTLSGTNTSTSNYGLISWADDATQSYFNSIFEKGKTFTLSVNNNLTGLYFQMNYFKEGSLSQSSMAYLYNFANKSTFTIPQDFDRIGVIFLGVLGTATTVNGSFSMQLEEGSDKTSFEPYTNGASPNPSYPQDIQVVSGNNTIKVEGKNLFNPNNAMVKQVSNFASNNILNATTNTSISINNNNYLSGTSNSYIVVATPFDYISGKTLYNVGYKGSRKMIVYDNTGAVLDVFYPNDAPYTPTTNFSGYLGVGIDTNKSVDNEYIMISYDNNATYQAYQGSQTYPINLPVENLLNKPWEQKSFNYITGVLATYDDANVIRSGAYQIKPNTDYTFSCNAPLGEIAVFYYQSDGTTVIAGSHSITDNNYWSFKTPDNAYYVYIRIGYSTRPKNVNVDYQQQLEEGTHANHYTPYGTTPIELCKIGTYQDKIAKSTGKNLFDKDSMTWVRNNNDNPTDTSNTNVSRIRTQTLIKLEGGKTYTISGIPNGVQSTPYVKFYASSTSTTKTSGENGSTFTVPSNAPYVIFQFSGENFTDATNLLMKNANIQLEQGSQATSYEPYGTSWYLYKEIGKNTISSNMQLYGNYGVDNKPLYYWDSLELHLPNIGVCNKFVLYETTTAEGVSYMPNNNFRTQGYTTVRYYFRYDDIESLQAFNTEISTNPLEIYYIKSTPTYTEITDTTLLSQLNALGNANSYNNQTNINQDNNNLASILNASALEEI